MDAEIPHLCNQDKMNPCATFHVWCLFFFHHSVKLNVGKNVRVLCYALGNTHSASGILASYNWRMFVISKPFQPVGLIPLWAPFQEPQTGSGENQSQKWADHSELLQSELLHILYLHHQSKKHYISRASLSKSTCGAGLVRSEGQRQRPRGPCCFVYCLWLLLVWCCYVCVFFHAVNYLEHRLDCGRVAYK